MSQGGSGAGSFLGLKQGGSEHLSESTTNLVGPSKGNSSMYRRQFKHEPVSVRGLSCVSFCWIVATILFTAGCCVAFAFPVWMVADQSDALIDTTARSPKPSDYIYNIQLGVTWYRANYSLDGGQSWNYISKYYLEFSDNDNDVLPKSASDISVILATATIFGTGCSLLIISVCIGLAACCKAKICGASVFFFAFLIQFLAGKFISKLCL